MEKYLIGYKQGDDSYAYVSSIDYRNINVTTIVDGAIDFTNETMAKNVCEFLNSVSEEITYTPLKVSVDIKEVK